MPSQNSKLTTLCVLWQMSLPTAANAPYLAVPSFPCSCTISKALQLSFRHLLFWLSYLRIFKSSSYHHQIRLSSNRFYPGASVPLLFWRFLPLCPTSWLFSYTPSVTSYLAFLPSHPAPHYPALVSWAVCSFPASLLVTPTWTHSYQLEA